MIIYTITFNTQKQSCNNDCNNDANDGNLMMENLKINVMKQQ